VIEVLGALTSSAAQSAARARSVDQDAPDGARRRTEKVRATVPSAIRVAAQAQVRFVHERGGLQRLAGRLAAQVTVGEPSQFGVHQRKELIGRAPIAALRLREQVGHRRRAAMSVARSLGIGSKGIRHTR